MCARPRIRRCRLCLLRGQTGRALYSTPCPIFATCSSRRWTGTCGTTSTARSASTSHPAGSTAPTPASTRSSRSASSFRARSRTWSPPCRSPPRCSVPITAARRRHQPVGPVDRPRHRHRLQQVPATRSSTSTRPAGVARVQPGVVLDQLNRGPGRARPAVRPGRGHRQPGQPRRHDRQQLRRRALHRLRQDHRPRPPARRRPRRRHAAPSSARSTAGEWDRRAQPAHARRRRSTATSRRWSREQRRRDPPPLPAHPAPRQRLQPRRALRWACTARPRGPGCTSWSSAARARWPSSPRPSWAWCRGRRCAACWCRSSPSLAAALDALAACLEFSPSAVELMDQMLLDLAARQPGAARHDGGDPAAGRRRCSWSSSAATTPAEVADRVERAAAAAARASTG